jgi:transposase
MSNPRLLPQGEQCSLAELETAMRCTPTQVASERMRAIRALLLGKAAQDVADIFQVSLHTLYRWIVSFNARGIDGLIDRPRTGRPRRIAVEKTATYRAVVEEPQSVGECHWTAKKFHGYLRSVCGEALSYSTVTRWLHEQNYRLKVPRPWPDRQDEAQREAFVVQLRQWLADEQIELWFSDESGFEGDPRPRRRWVPKGSRPTRVKNGDHLRMNVIGAVCPRTGECFAVEVSHCDTDCFQAFLTEAQAHLDWQRPTNLLVMDNASWHKVKHLDWGRFTPVYLPPYSPDLNPIERLWQCIKSEWFADFVAKNKPHLIERLDAALNWAMSRPNAIQKTCSIKTEL